MVFFTLILLEMVVAVPGALLVIGGVQIHPRLPQGTGRVPLLGGFLALTAACVLSGWWLFFGLRVLLLYLIALGFILALALIAWGARSYADGTRVVSLLRWLLLALGIALIAAAFGNFAHSIYYIMRWCPVYPGTCG